jgi:hypothetical protein
LNVGAVTVSADSLTVPREVATVAKATALPNSKNVFTRRLTRGSIITGSFTNIRFLSAIPPGS